MSKLISFIESPSNQLVQPFEYESSCKGYSVVVVGHSLGAGVASILTLLLKNLVPSAECVAYSCPGCIFSEGLAARSKQWQSTIFVGADCISRANWQTLKRVRVELIDVVRRCKKNKFSVFLSLFTRAKEEDLLFSNNEVPATEGT